MSKRKGLNDVLSNDRAVSRGAQGRSLLSDEWNASSWVSVESLKSHYDKSDSYFNDDHGSSHKAHKRCYESHPLLPLGEGFTVSGGSCSHVPSGFDIYIGFEVGMKLPNMKFPWRDQYSISFPIFDMGVTERPKDYIKLVEWTVEKIRLGCKVHAGCIGGHGRTGMFFAALVKHMMGIEDSITYVRKNYCAKAVESAEQIAFLHKHFGIKQVAANKKSYVSEHNSHATKDKSYNQYPLALTSSVKGDVISPIDMKNSIWIKS